MKSLLHTELVPRLCIAVALAIFTSSASHLTAGGVSKVSANGLTEQATFRTDEFSFHYPRSFQIRSQTRGPTVVNMAPLSRSQYWYDSITIRKLNKKTEECDLPQDSQPKNRDRRNIAGKRTYAYSSEDSAMNRYIRTKGYMIERGGYCWDFQMIRSGKPYRKFDLPENELKRLDARSDRDSRAANAAFKLILDSFVFLRPQ